MQVVAAVGAADVYFLQLALILTSSWRLVGKVFRVLLEGCTKRHYFDHLLAPETRREFKYPGQRQA